MVSVNIPNYNHAQYLRQRINSVLNQTHQNFEEILLSLSNVFKPIGPTNFQFRIDGNDIKLLEINPRISSATSIRSGFGYNESVMKVDYFLNNKIPQKLDKMKIINKHAIRYMEDYTLMYDWATKHYPNHLKSILDSKTFKLAKKIAGLKTNMATLLPKR